MKKNQTNSFLFIVFVALAGCAGTTEYTHTLHASNVDAMQTRDGHGNRVSMVDTRETDDACMRRWGQTLPKKAPKDDEGARLYQLRLDAIIARCEARGDQGVATALNRPMPPVMPTSPYGGIVTGNGVVWPGYAATAPYYQSSVVGVVQTPNSNATASSNTDEVKELKEDVGAATRLIVVQKKQIDEIKQKLDADKAQSTPPAPTTAPADKQ